MRRRRRKLVARRLPPVHPGEVLREAISRTHEVHRLRGSARVRYAAHAHRTAGTPGDAGHPNTALRLSRYFGTTPVFWMGM